MHRSTALRDYTWKLNSPYPVTADVSIERLHVTDFTTEEAAQFFECGLAHQDFGERLH